jgi:hypothetical protein
VDGRIVDGRIGQKMSCMNHRGRTFPMIESMDSANKFISSTQRTELLERIASSSELRRAARLRDFLRYVGQRVIEEEHVQISESEIGVHVFGRPENYDTSIDNIVRVNASELRKRIAAFYTSEGAHDLILVEIPRGSYTPVFSHRPVESVELPETVDVGADSNGALHVQALQPTHSFGNWLYPKAAMALIVLFAISTGYFFFQNRSIQQQFCPWRQEPTLGPFWTGFLQSPRQTDIVVADTSVALVEDVLNRHITLNDYLNRNYIQQILSSDLSPERKNDLRMISLRGNGSVGDFRVAEKILAFEPFSRRARLQFAREYQPSALKGHNVILIGSSRSNPWTSLFEGRLTFVLDYDLDRHEMLVLNRHPRTGESQIYSVPADSRVSTGLSVIDYLPNNDHTADVLMVAGTSAEATEAAGDFLTSEESLHRFQNKLQMRALPYFEILLKTTKVAGTPLAAEVIAYRTLPDPPVNTR